MAFETRSKQAECITVFVGMYQGIVSDIGAYRKDEDAVTAFETYSGVRWAADASDKLHPKLEGTTLYEIPLR
jgi:hypothetical protein